MEQEPSRADLALRLVMQRLVAQAAQQALPESAQRLQVRGASSSAGPWAGVCEG